MSIYETPLSNIQEVVERSLFHSIRRHCVGKSFTPNINDYPNTPTGYDAYIAAFAPIITAKGFAIEVFNSGPPTDRELKQVPRLVIDTQGFIPGSIGGDQSQKYRMDESGKYYGYITPPTTSDLYVNLHMVAGTPEQHRILNSILSLAIPRRGYVPFYNDENEVFFVQFLSYVPVREIGSPGIMETIARYVCKDLIEVEEIINIPPIISPLLRFDLHIESGETESHHIIGDEEAESESSAPPPGSKVT